MKKILLKYLNLYVLSGLLLVGFAGCSDDKDNDPGNPGPDVEELPSIGTYSFRGKRTGSCPVWLLWTAAILPVSFSPGKDTGRWED